MKLKIPRVRGKRAQTSVSSRILVRRLKHAYQRSREERRKRKIDELYVRGRVMLPEAEEKPKAEEPKPEEMGVEIPSELIPYARKAAAPLARPEEELTGIDIYYPLIPYSPKEGDRIFAYAHIKWDPKSESVAYSVVEPYLSPEDKKLVKKIRKMLEERLDIDFAKLGTVKAQQILRNEISKSLSLLGEVSQKRREVIEYYIEREIVGLGKIESLMKDPEIEDISCDGQGIPLFVYHRDPRFASLRTNISFDTKEELDDFVMRVAQKTGKMISIAEPLLDAALPDGSRLQATLGTDIARKGSNFTIRKFTAKPLTPVHMLKYGTLDSMELAYLWLAIENGKSMLLSGGTATGKTSLLNALSLFIKPEFKVVSIEDTAELRLPHPHWVPHVARTPLSVGEKTGEVSLFDLLKSSLRQRPDYLVVGEVRGKEAFVLFQQIATGHPSLATIHAATLPQLIDRLTTPPISLPPTLIENIDVIIFLVVTKIEGKYVRRANEIMELTEVKEGRPITKNVFEWRPVGDKFESVGKSKILEDVSKRLGVSEDSIKEELIRRKKVLEWMLDRNVLNYEEVAKIINNYYTNPKKLMSIVEET